MVLLVQVIVKLILNLMNNLEDYNGIRLTLHEKICAKRMAQLVN